MPIRPFRECQCICLLFFLGRGGGGHSFTFENRTEYDMRRTLDLKRGKIPETGNSPRWHLRSRATGGRAQSEGAVPSPPGRSHPGLSPPRLTNQKRVGVLFSRAPWNPQDPNLVRDVSEDCHLSTVASWGQGDLPPQGFSCLPHPGSLARGVMQVPFPAHAHAPLASRCSAGHG